MDRLRENAVVTISLPTGSNFRVMDFHATVIALIESGAALHPIDVALPPGRAENVFLSFVHGGHLVGLKGTLISHADGRGVRFEISDGVHMRRSRYTRVDAELPVTVGGTPGSTINVAPEGLLVKASLTVELGQLLDVTLALPGRRRPARADREGRPSRGRDDRAALPGRAGAREGRGRRVRRRAPRGGAADGLELGAAERDERLVDPAGHEHLGVVEQHGRRGRAAVV